MVEKISLFLWYLWRHSRNVLALYFCFCHQKTRQQDNKTNVERIVNVNNEKFFTFFFFPSFGYTQNYISSLTLTNALFIDENQTWYHKFSRESEMRKNFFLMVFNQFFALCLTLYTHLITISPSLSIYFFYRFSFYFSFFCRMCVDICFIVSSIHKNALRRRNFYFFLSLIFSLLEFLCSFEELFFMAEYMLYLSHNTISYHFDITQMLISSALYSFFWWLIFFLLFSPRK